MAPVTGRIVPFKTPARARVAASGANTTSLRPQDPPHGAGSRGTAASPLPSWSSRFRALILPHMDSAYSMARYLSRDAVVAEDIAQEALLKAYRSFDGYRGGDPKAWLLAIVRNTWFDHARSRRPSGDDAQLDEIPDDSPTAEAQLIRRGDAEALRSAIGAIPEPFREALILRDLEELSYKVIAQITAVPMGTVMSRLARARGLLARRMGIQTSEAAS